MTQQHILDLYPTFQSYLEAQMIKMKADTLQDMPDYYIAETIKGVSLHNYMVEIQYDNKKFNVDRQPAKATTLPEWVQKDPTALHFKNRWPSKQLYIAHELQDIADRYNISIEQAQQTKSGNIEKLAKKYAEQIQKSNELMHVN